MFEIDLSGKIKRYSKGMKQKVGIIAAFMHDPAETWPTPLRPQTPRPCCGR